MKKLATTCMLLAFATAAMAITIRVWKPAILYTHDGRQIECITKGPSSKKISYKLNESAKKQTIAADSVKYVEYPTEDGHIRLWLNTAIRYVKRDGSLIKPPTMSISTAKTHWVQLYDDPRGSNKTVMFVWAVAVQNGTAYYYGCYRDSDDYAVLCTYGLTYSEENAIKVYMSDCPSIVEYVSQKGVKIRNGNDVQKLIDEYNACK